VLMTGIMVGLCRILYPDNNGSGYWKFGGIRLGAACCVE